MMKALLVFAAALALMAGAATVDATPAHSTSVHGDVVGDGGSTTSFCGPGTSLPKVVFTFYPEFGWDWYECGEHYGYVVESRCFNCSENSLLYMPQADVGAQGPLMIWDWKAD